MSELESAVRDVRGELDRREAALEAASASLQQAKRDMSSLQSRSDASAEQSATELSDRESELAAARAMCERLSVK